jgi:hypothetical protein
MEIRGDPPGVSLGGGTQEVGFVTDNLPDEKS